MLGRGKTGARLLLPPYDERRGGDEGDRRSTNEATMDMSGVVRESSSVSKRRLYCI